ncbi:restriction endonuclease subunit S [Streptococcus dentasini]
MAQAIFKSWFVDFKSFGGVMPNDWKVANLTDIAEYLNGLAMQKYRPLDDEEALPVLKIKELRQGTFDSSSDLCSTKIKSQYIVKDGDVIFSWSGSLLVDFWTGGIGGLNQHLFKVSSHDYDKWFYYSWTKYHLEEFTAIAADKATTMGHITRSSLEKAEVLIPNTQDYKTLGALLEPIYDQIISNRIENHKLMKTRDTLLPKLLSGEFPVN